MQAIASVMVFGMNKIFLGFSVKDIEMAEDAVFVSTLRQLVVLLPIAFVLSKIFGLSYIWSPFLIAENVAVTLGAICLKHLYNRKIKPLDN